MKLSVIDVLQTYGVEMPKSFLQGEELRNAANDIDILLIYSERSDNIIHDLNFICSILEKECGLPVDFTVLSIEEERETNFLTRISSSYLKLK